MKERAAGFYAMLTVLAMLIIGLFPISALAAAGEIDYRPLEKELRDYLKLQKGFYGIYIMDLKSGKDFGINELEKFHAASTFKVPMALYVYRLVAEDKLNPDKMLSLNSPHLEGGTGRLQFSPPGTSKSVDELVRYAIVYSDNVATNILLELVGKKEIKEYMASLGGEVIDYHGNVTCPRDMAVYMREAVRFAGENEWGEKLMHHLRNTVYTDRIPYLLPDVSIANKIGNWPPTGTYNDIAYVEHPERPYIISVFSRQTAGYYEAVRVIREISRRVYEYQGNHALIVELVLDGDVLTLTERPFVYRGVTLVPLRALADAVPEININWDESSGVINLGSKLGGVKKEITIGQDDQVVIIEGRSYMPVRDLCHMLDLGLEWDSKNTGANIITGFRKDGW